MEKTPFQRGISSDKSTRKATLALPSEADFENHVPANAQEVKNIYAFGVARNRLLQVIKNMGVPARIVRNLEDADTFVTQRRYYRERLQPVIQAEEMSIPVFVIKSNSVNQIEQFLANLFMMPAPHNMMSEHNEALEQAEDAIQMVLAGEKYVDLRPASANVRREQHQLAQKASLVSQSFGTEPNRFVRIFRD